MATGLICGAEYEIKHLTIGVSVQQVQENDMFYNLIIQNDRTIISWNITMCNDTRFQ